MDMNAFREIQPSQAIVPLKKVQKRVKKDKQEESKKDKQSEKENSKENDIGDHTINEYI